MLSALLLAIFLPLPKIAAAANTLLTSPLYGNPVGGAPFDDGTRVVIPHVARLYSMLFCYGDWIFGIQLVYILEDNKTFVASPHGKINENCSTSEDLTMSKIVFNEHERLVHIEGLADMNERWRYVSQLRLFTSVNGRPPVFRGGATGRISGLPFSLTGDIRGIFGRSGSVLNALGFYINASLPLSTYNKTSLFAGAEGGIEFDDFRNLLSRNVTPIKITNMIINRNKVINGIKVTYMVSRGPPINITHGTLAANNTSGHSSLSILDFEADEWITEVTFAISDPAVSPILGVLCLEVETTNSKGTVRSYGPFGSHPCYGTLIIEGVFYGLYGRVGGVRNDSIYAIGFYV